MPSPDQHATSPPPSPAIMPVENIPDWEQRLARQDAFWDCAIIDRPVVTIGIPARKRIVLPPAPANIRERWLDTQYIVDCALARVANTEYLGDALPSAYPNLGPDVFAGYLGCDIKFAESTSWSVPALHDWADAGDVQFNEDNVWWCKTLEITDALIEAGRGRFYTGITDLHPGGDALAALRGPEPLNYDMIEAVDQVKDLLARIGEAYFTCYDAFYRRLTAAGQAMTSWPSIVSTRKWYVPSNDFSCMVSKAMFDDVFLPGIAEECRFMDASIYHLDGTTALQHLDSLLEIPELNAIQWVYGAGRGRASDWLHVYRRCQQAGKGIQLHVAPDELDTIMEDLRPEGVWIGITGVQTRDAAETLIRRIEEWR